MSAMNRRVKMKCRSGWFLIISGLILIGSLSLGCSSGGGDDDSDGSPSQDFTTGGGTLKRNVIDNYVNDLIIETYTRLDNAAQDLVSAVNALSASPSQETLTAARSAWVRTRIPWEQSETALFGPVDFYGFDPALDTWPVNRTDLEAVLNGNATLNAQTVANFDNSLKGFHTIEFLLYGEGGAKAAADLTPREFTYLIATTDQLKSVTSALLRAWTEGIEGQPPYALEVVRAGQGSVAYPTEESVIEQMVRGMITICDEVANGKIADPFDTRNPNIVESQFSYNSIIDFSNNITGVKLALDRAVSAFISAGDAELNAQLVAAVNNAIVAIQRIPEPFRSAILDSSNDNTIVTAQEAVREVQRILETEVLPLILS